MAIFLRHHLKNAGPLIFGTGLLMGVGLLARGINDVISAQPGSGISGVFGEGIDVSSAYIATALQPLLEHGSWLPIVALSATALSTISALRQLIQWIRGPGDVGGLAHHASQRMISLTGTDVTRVRWGTVMDAYTGAPLPFARVAILDASGMRLAHTVSDTHGAYGFALPREAVTERGGIGGIEVRKDGYYQLTHAHPITAGSWAVPSDLRLEPRQGISNRQGFGFPRGFSSLAFWAGIATVPMAYPLIAAPGIANAMIALFAFSAVIRAIGARP